MGWWPTRSCSRVRGRCGQSVVMAVSLQLPLLPYTGVSAEVGASRPVEALGGGGGVQTRQERTCDQQGTWPEPWQGGRREARPRPGRPMYPGRRS